MENHEGVLAAKEPDHMDNLRTLLESGNQDTIISYATEIHKQDCEKGLELIREIAISGNIEAQYLYALWSGDSFNLESYIFLKMAADKGHKKACRLIALSYCTNPIMAKSFHPNFDLLLDFLVRSIESNTQKRSLKHVISLPGVNLSDTEMISILTFVKTSDATPETFCNCLRWFAELVFRGVIQCRDDLKPALLELYQHGVKTKSANAGEAAFALGLLYLMEFFGVDLRIKCFNMFKASIFANYSKTEPYMALCYFRGIGTAKDVKTGYVHLEKCIENPGIITSFVKAFSMRGDYASISLLEHNSPPNLAKYFRK